MKTWGWAFFALFLTSGLVAQSMDQPVATVRLDKKTGLVTQSEFRGRESAIEAQRGGKILTRDEKNKLLQELITGKLIELDVANKGIKATDEDLLVQFRAQNPGMTDAQIRSAVEQQSGQTWEEATKGLKQQVVNNRYFSQQPGFKALQDITVSDSEIQEYYDSNPAQFISPDYVRVSHIFFDTKIHPKGTPAEIRKRADDALAAIKSGKVTFEEEATKVSEDPTSARQNGDIGYVPRSLDSQAGQRLLSIFGKEFLDNLFALKKGEISPVLVSNSGLHIVRITQKIEKHFLKLDDDVYPGNDQLTVKKAIEQSLLHRKEMEAQAQLVLKVGDELRTKATIKTFEQNF